MARMTQDNKVQTVVPLPEDQVIVPVSVDIDHVRSLFSREHNSLTGVKSITMKRTLTRPLLSAAHFKQLLFTATSEMYLMPLPNSGRGGGLSDTLVLDGVDVETGTDSTLIISAMIGGALQKGGFACKTPVVKDGQTEGFLNHEGTPLVGHSFAFRAGGIKEGKGYRSVETVEVTIER